MATASNEKSSEPSGDSGPDFLEFLGGELNVPEQEVTALLGRWLLDYQPLATREIQVLRPAVADAQAWAFAQEASP